jgi:DUF1707 SHOCT-like domain/Domain of unknown function (DUF4234)
MGVEREQLRISDAERQAAAESLGAAFRDGRLDPVEYDERLAHAYSAVTYGDLDRLFTDLPRPAPRTVYPPYRPAPGWYPLPAAGTYGYAAMPVPQTSGQHPQPMGPAGQVRTTALQMLLFVVTLGIWGYVYVFQTHDEIKRHSGEGIGGVLALIVSLVAYVASPFLLSHEVGGLYERAGRRRPVSALTGLWFFPGIFLLVGPIIWFALTNSALNDYWRSRGAR